MCVAHAFAPSSVLGRGGMDSGSGAGMTDGGLWGWEIERLVVEMVDWEGVGT